MRLAVLSRKERLYSTSRLVEAARRRGHDVVVIDPIKCYVVVAQGSHRIYCQGDELAPVDAVIPRIGASVTDYGLAMLAHFSRAGIATANSISAIASSRDKLRALQILSRSQIPIPRTALVREPGNVRHAVEALGGTPIVIKLLQGTQGVGVMIADSSQALESTLDTLWGLGQNLILQEFIAESAGRDVRAFVVGGKVVAAMQRTAKVGEFRANLHRGGEGRPFALDPEGERTAVEAARVLGLDVAGVDLLESSTGHKVIEINSSPGLRGIEQATGVDVADAVCAHVEALVLRASRDGGRPFGGLLGDALEPGPVELSPALSTI
jgi:ribosomal protein S6--L-glutamate ligase